MKWKFSLSATSDHKFSLKLLLKNIKRFWNEMGTAYYATNLRKCLNKAKQTTFRIFQNSERNLVMHFHKTVYTDIFHNFIRFHWVSEIYTVPELEVRFSKRLEMIEKQNNFCISCLYLQEYKKGFAFLT